VVNPWVKTKVKLGPWLMDIRWMEIEDMVAGPSILVNPWMQPETIGMDAGCPSIVVNAWIKMKLGPWQTDIWMEIKNMYARTPFVVEWTV